MPIFEFRCEECGKKFQTLVGMVASDEEDVCPHCQSPKITKLVSRFLKGRSEDDRVDEMADQFEQYGEPESASQMREMVKEMGKAMDDDMSEELEDMFESDMEGKFADEEEL